MNNLPVLAYVCKAKPFLEKGGDPTCKDEYQLFDWVCEEDKNTKVLNGLVAFECECKELYRYDNTGGAFYQGYAHSEEAPAGIPFTKRAVVSYRDVILNYAKGKTFYALHFENFRAIKPMKVGQLFSDYACAKPLKCAPQSWGYAYRKVRFSDKVDWMSYYLTHEVVFISGGEDKKNMFVIEKVVLISIRPRWAMELANHASDPKNFPKDLEIRTRAWKGLKER